MRRGLRRTARVLTLVVFGFGLFAVLVLAVLAAPSTPGHADGILAQGFSQGVQAGSSPTRTLFRFLPTANLSAAAAVAPEAPAAPDFRFDKKVMLRADYDAAGCTGATDSLTVWYSTTVAYCYFVTNIGTTTWVTHTMVDDKLGSIGPVTLNLPPGGQIGLAGLPPALLQDVTNTATWTALDTNNTQLSRTDKVTVKVVIPLTGHVFIDQNGDGIRNPTETSGVSGVRVDLIPRPYDAKLQRQTTTFAAGYYEFLDPAAGAYTVSVQLPAGYVATSPTQAPVTLVFPTAKVVNFGVRAATATPTPTATQTPEITFTPTETPTETPTASPTVTEGPTPTASPTPVESFTPTATATEAGTPTSTRVPDVYLPMVIQLPPDMKPPLAPSLMPIDAPGGNPSYLISWTPIYGADGYEVEQAQSADFSTGTGVVYSGTHTSFHMPSHGIGTFYFRVRARNFVGTSTWSDVQAAQLAWETEPNNVLTEANTGVTSGATLYALPDDPSDFFHVKTNQSGLVTARIGGMVGESVRVVLYYDNIGNILMTDTTAPYEVSSYGGMGDYYVRVFVGAGYSAIIPYELVVTYQ